MLEQVLDSRGYHAVLSILPVRSHGISLPRSGLTVGENGEIVTLEELLVDGLGKDGIIDLSGVARGRKDGVIGVYLCKSVNGVRNVD